MNVSCSICSVRLLRTCNLVRLGVRLFLLHTSWRSACSMLTYSFLSHSGRRPAAMAGFFHAVIPRKGTLDSDTLGSLRNGVWVGAGWIVVWESPRFDPTPKRASSLTKFLRMLWTTLASCDSGVGWQGLYAGQVRTALLNMAFVCVEEFDSDTRRARLGHEALKLRTLLLWGVLGSLRLHGS